MLEAEGLRAWYGAAQILFDLDFQVGTGEVVALMGRNGAGKSTTIKSLMALIPQRSGTVRFLGEDISKLKPFEIARRGLPSCPKTAASSRISPCSKIDVGRQPPRRHRDGRPAPSWTRKSCSPSFPISPPCPIVAARR